MPCYDKKLEASRQDFYNEIYGTRDVDCVITTGELELMMREKGWDLSMAVVGENEEQPLRSFFDQEANTVTKRPEHNPPKDTDKSNTFDSVDPIGNCSDARLFDGKSSQTQNQPSLVNGFDRKSVNGGARHVADNNNKDDSHDDFVFGRGPSSTETNLKQEMNSKNGDDSLSFDLPELINHPGSSSGSYLHSLISMLTIMSSSSPTIPRSSTSPTPSFPFHSSSSPRAHSHAPDSAQNEFKCQDQHHHNHQDSKPSAPTTAESNLELTTRTIRSADYEEYILTDRNTGQIIFRGAKCNGFRNLQNVVRKVGRDAGVQVGRGAAGKLAGLRANRMRKGGAAKDGGGGTGYDYVEVMACPGGCINGGGQLRPPASLHPTNMTSIGTDIDEEGFQRDWASQGVSVNGNTPTNNTGPNPNGEVEGARIQGQGAKWGDKEWTKKVEMMYWNGLPTPPPTPDLSPEETRRQGPIDVLSEKKIIQAQVAADRLAARALRDLCHPEQATDQFEWQTEMDEQAETKRRTMFRTQYRAVESEVVGLAVKW